MIAGYLALGKLFQQMPEPYSRKEEIMPEETEVEKPSAIQKALTRVAKKRALKRHYPETTAADPISRPAVGAKALTEIDTRLTAAIQLRSEALHKVSLLVYWQDKLARVTAEIDQLISYQRRLTGQPETTPHFPVGGTGSNPAVPGYSFNQDIPPNAGSIPAKLPKVGPNAADQVRSEGGFS